MLSLLIPSIGLAASVQTGSIWDTGDKTFSAHYEEADRILAESAYKYPHHNVIGGHSDREPFTFRTLPKIKKNALVVYNGKRFRVKETFTVPETKVSTLLGKYDGLTLFTCVHGGRFVVRAK